MVEEIAGGVLDNMADAKQPVMSAVPRERILRSLDGLEYDPDKDMLGAGAFGTVFRGTSEEDGDASVRRCRRRGSTEEERSRSGGEEEQEERERRGGRGELRMKHISHAT